MECFIHDLAFEVLGSGHRPGAVILMIRRLTRLCIEHSCSNMLYILTWAPLLILILRVLRLPAPPVIL
ncbi:hypothetical protein DAEQUDRAFT_349795 [Daedalea quercina L-15889]|uniref:Uncharacterized protein n=1 Tax=Daedalea quercina L-15889 TaxID=1314783 RepID=A0A165PE53_9APHY|nr:hypothetical protein DAEQUDRAFT_349795 [Daedalea quercina L-15889]